MIGAGTLVHFKSLLDGCHAADGPSRALDAAIFIAITPGVADAGRIDVVGGMVGWWPRIGGGYQSAREVPRYTDSIEAVVELIRTSLPGFWWTCGFCALTDDASIYPRGTTTANLGVDHRQGDPSKLLDHPTMSREFDRGFHCDRAGGTVALSLLSAFFQAKIAVARAEQL